VSPDFLLMPFDPRFMLLGSYHLSFIQIWTNIVVIDLMESLRTEKEQGLSYFIK